MAINQINETRSIEVDKDYMIVGLAQSVMKMFSLGSQLKFGYDEQKFL